MRLLAEVPNGLVFKTCNLRVATVVDKTIEPQGSIGDIETKELSSDSVEIIEKEADVCEEEKE